MPDPVIDPMAGIRSLPPMCGKLGEGLAEDPDQGVEDRDQRAAAAGHPLQLVIAEFGARGERRHRQ